MAEALRTIQANRDLLEIWVYTAERSPQSADRVIDTITAVLQELAQMPGMGRSREDYLPGMRSFPAGNYVIYYRPIADGIRVLRVLHGARNMEDVFPYFPAESE